MYIFVKIFILYILKEKTDLIGENILISPRITEKLLIKRLKISPAVLVLRATPKLKRTLSKANDLSEISGIISDALVISSLIACTSTDGFW